MSEEIYDVVIVGGGPAGLSAAQYAARSDLKTLVLDKSSTAGALAFTNRIENYPGLSEPVTGKALLDTFRAQAVRFGAEVIDDAQVVGVGLTGEVKEVYTMQAAYKAKAVIIATGAMGRKPTIEGEGEFLGRGVSYCAICDANFFRGHTVCVLGDSEEAVKEAGLLTKFAATVYLISPTDALKVPDGHPALGAENLKVLKGRRVVRIEGADSVAGIVMKDAGGNEDPLAVTGVFVYIHGSRPIVDFLMGALETGENECLSTGHRMETSAEGVFAAGDVRCTEVRQVVIAAADGCLAALAAENYINHRKKMKSDWVKGK